MFKTTTKKFQTLWRKYFGKADLPIAFYYTDNEEDVETLEPPLGHHCIIADLVKAARGRSLRFGADSFGCSGAERYTGFTNTIRPDFEHFLSCGIPGKVDGERYKKSPDLVKKAIRNMPRLEAPKKHIIFKRLDMLSEKDDPEAFIFFARPDVLSGLFTLANFDEEEPNAVIAPFCAGCGSIIQYPYLEQRSDRPRCILGMFDVSARPYVSRNTLSFAVPAKKFIRMVDNMEESFLITPSWGRIHSRAAKK